MIPSPALLRLAPLALLTGLAPAQINTIPGTDVSLGLLEGVEFQGRSGAYPGGESAFSMSTTSCNYGTVDVPWLRPMDSNHPFIAFLMVREHDGRMVQISDRSWLKHGFYALSNSQCIPCQNPSNGTFLGVGCSDTYGTSTNADNYYLGPPSEVDPWLGTWDPRCSHFDRGEPAAAPPLDCDGLRSFTRNQAGALGPLGHRVRVRDADLAVPAASYWYQAQYVIRAESELNRTNNLGSRRFRPSWDSGRNRWNVSVSDNLLHGSVLQRWSGATLGSASNNLDDGRVYVALKVSGPVGGLYRYEYAVHNRDNSRGVSAFRLPVCPNARVMNPGFRDIDADPQNDWSFSRAGGALAWTGTTNPLEWNTIYNFWFESDAAPETARAGLDQHRAGAGLPFFNVDTQAPLGLYNVYLGAGCGNPNAPRLIAAGLPARATLGNTSFRLLSQGNQGGAGVFFLLSTFPGNLNLGAGCTLWLSPLPSQPFLGLPTVADPFGVAQLPLPVPGDPSFEGLDLEFQTLEVQPGTGALGGMFDLSNGLRVRVGSSISPCR